MHHIIVYQCHVTGDSSFDSAQLFESSAVSGRGEKCNSPNMPAQWKYCQTNAVFGWVRMAPNVTLKKH